MAESHEQSGRRFAESLSFGDEEPWEDLESAREALVCAIEGMHPDDIDAEQLAALGRVLETWLRRGTAV